MLNQQQNQQKEQKNSLTILFFIENEIFSILIIKVLCVFFLNFKSISPFYLSVYYIFKLDKQKKENF